MTVPGIKKIFSAVAMTAAVVTLTLASADVLASGKGNNGKGNATASQNSSANANNSNGKGKGHSHNSNGQGHQPGHPGHENGKGHDKHHDHDHDDGQDDSCEAPGDDHDHDGKGHNKHQGQGHQHDHPGYINGKGHHKHHDHDDEDDLCGGGDDGGDTGGGDTGGGDTGGGDDDGNDVVLPEGCFLTSAYSDNSFASVFGSNRFGYVINAGTVANDFSTDAATKDGQSLGTFDISLYAEYDFGYVFLTTATGYEVRALNAFLGDLGSYQLDSEFTYQWTGKDFTHEITFDSSLGETAELVIEAVLCEVGSPPVSN